MTADNALQLARACVARMLADDVASRSLGMTVEIPEAGRARVSMQVGSDMVNGHGICHGGYVFTLADSAFAFACNAYNRVTVSAGATIDYLTPARAGETLVANASEVRRGRRHGVYDVSVTAAEGRRIAVFRGHCIARDEPVLPP